MKNQKAYGYLRVSTKGQAKEDKHGFKRQKEVIESFAKNAGFNIIRYYKEPVSGCKGEEDRPAFMEMVSTILRENCISCILPTPSKYFSSIIENCNQDIFIEGDPIGGGTIPSLLKRHLKKGYRAIMTEEAAFTVRNNLDEVRSYGIEINHTNPEDFKGTRLKFHEIQLTRLRDFLTNFGEELDVDLVAIAVQDHGTPPKGISNREFRFKMIEQRLKKENIPESFVYVQNEIPAFFKRMQAIARTAKLQLGCEVLMMDTSFAAILGCLEESNSSMFVNVGNSHTLIAMISEERIVGLLEHHTSCLTPEKLDDLLVRFMRGEVTSREILADGGHGAVILSSGLKENEEIVVTGPNRGMLKTSSLNIRFAAPHGNMMLTGPFGLVRGAQLKYRTV